MRIKEEMHDYEYVEIITENCPNGFTHTNCRMGFILDQGIVVQCKDYDYFYPMNGVLRVCTK